MAAKEWDQHAVLCEDRRTGPRHTLEADAPDPQMGVSLAQRRCQKPTRSDSSGWAGGGRPLDSSVLDIPRSKGD
jgi:hypothetical protein